MGVLVRVPAGGDRHAVGVVRRIVARRDGPQDGLRVGARQVAEPVGDPRQVAVVLQGVQELLGAQRGGCEDHLVGGDDPRRGLGPPLRLGVLHVDLVATQATRHDARDRGQRQDRGTLLLREVEVVLDQGVLRVVPTPRHALAAVDAGVALGALAAEVRIVDLGPRPLLGTAEEDSHRSRVEGVAGAHVGRHLLHHVVGRRTDGVLDHAEHPLGLVVVRRQLVLPVRDPRPLRVAVERVERLVERVGVDQRSATHAGPGHDHRVAHGVDALDAVAPDRRRPQVALEVEGPGGEVGVLETGAGLEHADLVALLGQPQRRDGSAEAGPDHQDVEVGLLRACGLGHQALPSFFMNFRLAVITLA